MSTQYLIYCKFTHKHIATYTNKKSLETLDTSRCYYVEKTEKVFPSEITSEFYFNKDKGRKIEDFLCGPRSSNPLNDYMSPLNPIGYYATTLSSSSSYSDCSSSSSSSSYDSSSSSSCDSSSSW